MNVGFHHKRISPRFLRGFGLEFVSRTDGQVTDLLDRFRLEKTHVIVNASPAETSVFLPIADPHDVSQRAMLFREIL